MGILVVVLYGATLRAYSTGYSTRYSAGYSMEYVGRTRSNITGICLVLHRHYRGTQGVLGGVPKGVLGGVPEGVLGATVTDA
jgi:hypothetical protein